MRRYYEYFPMGDEKNIKLNNSFGSTLITVKREDLASSYDLDIQILNKSQEDENSQKKLAAYLAMWQIVLSDPETPRISKLFYKRMLAKLQWVSREERDIIYYDPILEEAKRQLELINDEEDVVPLIEADEDHISFILVYHKALDNKEKERAIAKRKEFIYLQWRKEQPTQDLWGVAWASINAALQQPQEQWASSLQDIQAQ